MSLLFVCDYCSEQYNAERSGVGIRYKYEDGKEWKLTPDEPCHNCSAAADKAREEALEKRKKKI